MSPFHYPHAVLSLRFPELVEANRQLRETLRKRGLPLDSAIVEPASMERGASALKRWLAQGGGARPPMEVRMWLSSIVAWMGSRPQWQHLVREIIAAVSVGRFDPLPRHWWPLVVRYPRHLPLRHAFWRQLVGWDEKKRARHVPVSMTRLEPGVDLAIAVADDVVRRGISILDYSTEFKLEPTTELASSVQKHLTSLEASPWLVSHSQETMKAFLHKHDKEEIVGRVGRALLEPMFDRLSGPQEVGPGQPLGELVALIHHHLPAPRNTPAWKALGEKARQMVIWHETQAHIKAFIRRWPAEKIRIAYWVGHIRNAADVRFYEKAGVMAFKIGDYWFVEVGNTGYAAYVYHPGSMKSLEGRFAEATQPGVFRQYRDDSLNHNSGWYEKFDDQIWRMARVRRDPGASERFWGTDD